MSRCAVCLTLLDVGLGGPGLTGSLPQSGRLEKWLAAHRPFRPASTHAETKSETTGHGMTAPETANHKLTQSSKAARPKVRRFDLSTLCRTSSASAGPRGQRATGATSSPRVKWNASPVLRSVHGFVPLIR